MFRRFIGGAESLKEPSPEEMGLSVTEERPLADGELALTKSAPLLTPLLVAGKSKRVWFHVLVVYVRVSSSACSPELLPEFLKFRCPPRNLSTSLEVNGARVSPNEEVCLSLRRDRVTTDEEATYVCTDTMHVSGTLEFQICHEKEGIVAGHLAFERARDASGSCTPTTPVAPTGNALAEESKALVVSAADSPNSSRMGCDGRTWSLDCKCTASPSCEFLRPVHEDVVLRYSRGPPTIEVCVVGSHQGQHVCLSQNVIMLRKKRTGSKGSMLEAIPEDSEKARLVSATPDMLLSFEPTFDAYDDKLVSGDALIDGTGVDDGAMLSNIDAYNLDYLKRDGLFAANYSDGSDDGEMTWFNIGLRVGVGVGLGICLGVGLGVGLMVRTYQKTTSSIRKRLW